MNKVRIKTPFRPVYPSPAAMIVSIDSNNNPNVMSAGEVFNISLRDPCIIGIALRKATYTHGLICESKEFTVNFPSVHQLTMMDLVGTCSGRDGFNKFAEYNIETIPSDEIRSPIIKACPMNLECIMMSVTEVGDHDLFLGKVVAMHVDEDKVDQHDKMLIEKMDGFLFAEWQYYNIGDKIGKFGFSRKAE